MKKGIGPRGLGAPKSAAKMYGAKSPAKQTAKSDRLMKKSDKLYDRANKNTTPTAEYDPIEGKVMNSEVYTRKGERLAKKSDKTFNRAVEMSRGEARRATREMFGK